MKVMEAQAKKESELEDARLEKQRIQQEKEEKNSKLQEKKKAELAAQRQEELALEQERRDQELAMRLALDAADSEQALSDEARKVAKEGITGGVRRKQKVKTETTSF